MFHLLYVVQKIAVKLVGDPVISSKLPHLAHRRAVSNLSQFYRYFQQLCPQELSSLPLQVPGRPTRGLSNQLPDDMFLSLFLIFTGLALISTDLKFKPYWPPQSVNSWAL